MGAKRKQLRRGTSYSHETFVGAVGELTMDTDNKNIRLHDGSTSGGVVIPNKEYVDNIIPSQENQDGKLLATNGSSTYWADVATPTDYVNISSDQTIDGTKTFLNTINGNISGDADTVDGLHASEFSRYVNISSANLDTLGINGVYGVYNAINSPSERNSGTLIVSHSSTIVNQLWQDDISMYSRRYISGSWTSWTEISFNKDYYALENRPVSIIESFTYGDTPVTSSVGLKTNQTTSYVKVKEIKVNLSGTVKVIFNLRASSGGNDAYGRLYKNGVAYTSAVLCPDSGANYTYYSYSVSVNAGDKIQLYIASRYTSNTADTELLEIRTGNGAVEVLM